MRPETLEACYTTLGLTPDAKFNDIKHAYRTLVKRWHPDRFATEILTGNARPWNIFMPLRTPMPYSGCTRPPQTLHTRTGVGGVSVGVPYLGLVEAPGVLV
jgi:hypothetical protein